MEYGSPGRVFSASPFLDPFLGKARRNFRGLWFTLPFFLFFPKSEAEEMREQMLSFECVAEVVVFQLFRLRLRSRSSINAIISSNSGGVPKIIPFILS